MKGDYISVTYKTGVGTEKTKVVADRSGSTVGYSVDRTWVTVDELDRAGKSISEARFAATEVVAVVRGHEKTKKK